jgi:hypothetical protein
MLYRQLWLQELYSAFVKLNLPMEPMEVCEGDFVVKSADFVKVFITVSNCSTYSAEKSFARAVTVADLKVCCANH